MGSTATAANAPEKSFYALNQGFAQASRSVNINASITGLPAPLNAALTMTNILALTDAQRADVLNVRLKNDPDIIAALQDDATATVLFVEIDAVAVAANLPGFDFDNMVAFDIDNTPASGS